MTTTVESQLPASASVTERRLRKACALVTALYHLDGGNPLQSATIQRVVGTAEHMSPKEWAGLAMIASVHAPSSETVDRYVLPKLREDLRLAQELRR